MSAVLLGHFEVELQAGVVDAAEIQRARRLELLRREAEGVHAQPVVVGDAGVVLVRLAQPEVLAVAHREALVPVQVEPHLVDRAVQSQVLVLTRGDLGVHHRDVRPNGLVPVVEGVRNLLVQGRVLGGPVDGLGRVVEVEAHGERRHRVVGELARDLAAGELQLLDQVLVRHLREPLALIGVQVEEVREQLRLVHHRGDMRFAAQLLVPHRAFCFISVEGTEDVGPVGELDGDPDLVVLERDQGQRRARVALGEEEVDRDEQLSRLGKVLLHDPIIVCIRKLRHRDDVSVVAAVAGHDVVADLLLALARELVPEVLEAAVGLVDLLAADLDLRRLDERVSKVVHVPDAILLGRTLCSTVIVIFFLLEVDLEPEAVQKVAVARDDGDHSVSKGGAVRLEGLLHGLHTEVGVAAVQVLEKGDLGVASEVHVLHSVRDKLHQASSAHECSDYICINPEKKHRRFRRPPDD